MAVFAFSDIHGQRHLFDALMAKIGPNDKAFFLGDAIDRGPDGWAIFKELIDDPRITFICGNHEDMMINALRTFPEIHWSKDMQVWGWNGNEPTLEAIRNDDPEVVKQYLDKARNLPIFQTYTSPVNGYTFWLSHAGCDYTENLDELDREHLIWDRSHFISNKWFHDDPDDLFIVHGHTPTLLLVEELSMYHDNIPEGDIEPGAYYYAGGHKICIDCGAHFTDMTVLLNLDTFDEEIFGIEDREIT